ncbi:MAG: RidA family protein [Oscillospiraceae bacterium]|nr:RidA family protein [Oscillospiraceae bacterium]
MQSIHTDQAPAAIGPYSQAQRVGGFVFVSGQIPVDPASGAIPAGVEAQAEQVFRNLAAILRAAGTDLSRTVKTTLFIQNMADFAAVNAIYARHFSEPYPVRSCVEVAKLPKDVLLECEAIAAVED